MVLRPSFTAAKSRAALEMGQEPAANTSSRLPAAAEEFVAIASSTRRAAPLAESDAHGVPLETLDMQRRWEDSKGRGEQAGGGRFRCWPRLAALKGVCRWPEAIYSGSRGLFTPLCPFPDLPESPRRSEPARAEPADKAPPVEKL